MAFTSISYVPIRSDLDCNQKYHRSRKFPYICLFVLQNPCKRTNGDSLCRLLGGCAIQLANDAVKMSTKPCVRAWLATHAFPLVGKQGSFETDQSNPDSSTMSAEITKIREIGATDLAMWLSATKNHKAVLNQSNERMLLLANHNQGDDWKEQ